MKRRCVDCEYYADREQCAIMGTCRINPPYNGTGERWPRVKETDWCGEFRIRNNSSGPFEALALMAKQDFEKKFEEFGRSHGTKCGEGKS